MTRSFYVGCGEGKIESIAWPRSELRRAAAARIPLVNHPPPPCQSIESPKKQGETTGPTGSNDLTSGVLPDGLLTSI
jgi:hypothetical protein